jgi:gliding motility-associated-like protein
MKTLANLIFVLIFCSAGLNAQLCAGSLGDPVVHITFGAGSGPGPALPANTTSYRYSTSSCPNDGEYSLISLSFDCFSGSWQALNGDHTPNDGIGRFMLINASETPGDFYLDTIRGLCPATNYEFATYVKNVLKPSACGNSGIKPNLTFRVETLGGTVLTTINSGDIPTEEVSNWTQYGAYLLTPPGVSDVVIRLTNNAPGGCGNDLAIDDITFRPCGPKINAVAISTNSGQVSACESESVNIPLSATYANGTYTNPSFQWQKSTDATNWVNIPGATSVNFTHPASPVGVYFYRMLVADGPNINSIPCRLATNTITVTITQPNAQVTNYVFGCFGKEVAFFAAGGSSYSWTGPNGFSSNIQGPSIKKIQFTDQGWYKVKVTDFRGCTDEDSTNLLVYPAATVTVNSGTTICEGASTQLNASGGTKYYWEPRQTLSVDSIPNPIASPKESTIYRIVMFNQYGCFDTASVEVKVWKKPKANAGPDKKTRQGYPVQLKGTVEGDGIKYYWTPTNFISDPNSLITKVTPTQSGIYTLHAESTHGCGVSTDDVFIRVYDKVVIPNAFSPNGDGINDTWIIEPLEFFEESVTTVYNRYGQPVFQSRGYSKPWDGTKNGKPVPVGTYYFVIDLKTNKERPLTGSLLIIR